jgi:hypothetical protein
MAEFTKDHIAGFAKDYFHDAPVSCPNCEGPLTVSESKVNQDWHSVGLSISCRRCSVTAWDDGRERAEGRRPYTDLEKDQIIEAAWRGLRPRCPLDESYVDVEKVPLMGGAVHFNVRCKYCGSMFQRSPA